MTLSVFLFNSGGLYYYGVIAHEDEWTELEYDRVCHGNWAAPLVGLRISYSTAETTKILPRPVFNLGGKKENRIIMLAATYV